MTRDYQVVQSHDSQLLTRFFRAEDAEHAAAKLVILIPICGWTHVGGTQYRLTLHATDCQTREKTEHTFAATVEVSQ
jgi:hypothetical protein